MFRGFEKILLNHDRLDFTQRICGVCPISHGITAFINETPITITILGVKPESPEPSLELSDIPNAALPPAAPLPTYSRLPTATALLICAILMYSPTAGSKTKDSLMQKADKKGLH